MSEKAVSKALELVRAALDSDGNMAIEDIEGLHRAENLLAFEVQEFTWRDYTVVRRRMLFMTAEDLELLQLDRL